MARVLVYLPPFIFKILDFICRMVLIFILIYFEWRDTENQQYPFLWPAKPAWEEHGKRLHKVVYDNQPNRLRRYSLSFVNAPWERGCQIHNKIGSTIEPG